MSTSNLNSNKHHVYIPNKDLSEEEIKAKRALKRQLKQQRKRASLEARLRHAIMRKDVTVQQETRLELSKFDNANNASCSDHATLDNDDKNLFGNPTARALVTQILQQLLSQQFPSTPTSTRVRQEQTKQAKTLLAHMTRGTQTQCMFAHADALWGYTRQKFFQRSMLICNSLCKLNTNHPTDSSCLLQLQQSIWNTVKQVESVCSIGCGPGNDVVGVLAFLAARITNGSPRLSRAILLDFVVDEWRLVLEPLQDLVVPKYIDKMEFGPCDISKKLSTCSNHKDEKMDTVISASTTETNDNQQARDLICGLQQQQDDEKHVSTVDLFTFSYILTETRGQWHDFVQDLIVLAKPSALFYFAEPTPWQLHLLLRQCSSLPLDFLWLDSSMMDPALQRLDRRVGPAVLVGRKKNNAATQVASE